MSVGIITGSGTYALPGFSGGEPIDAETPFGVTEVTRGTYAGVPGLHISRHKSGHIRLSNHVEHRANIWALKQLGATAVVACTACGAVDPALAPGSLVVFDDLHFLSNRLPDGSLCTFFAEPGDARRGHWILAGGPFSPGVRQSLLDGASRAGHSARDGGTYGHVDGPRFNTPSEIAQLASAGVAAVSQTAGPETVLCGELELPFALIGFVTDYANDVAPGEPTPVVELVELMGKSTQVFAEVLERALPLIERAPAAPAGVVYRLGDNG